MEALKEGRIPGRGGRMEAKRKQTVGKRERGILKLWVTGANHHVSSGENQMQPLPSKSRRMISPFINNPLKSHSWTIISPYVLWYWLPSGNIAEQLKLETHYWGATRSHPENALGWRTWWHPPFKINVLLFRLLYLCLWATKVMSGNMSGESHHFSHFFFRLWSCDHRAKWVSPGEGKTTLFCPLPEQPRNCSHMMPLIGPLETTSDGSYFWSWE